MDTKKKHEGSKGSRRILPVAGALVLFIAVNGTIAWIWLHSRMDSASSPRQELLSPVSGLINKDDLIINFQPLRDSLNEAYEADPTVSVYFEYLLTGANISISKDAEFYPASLVKVPIAMAVAKKIERGEWKWSNELVLLPSDRSSAFGTLWKEPSHSRFTIEKLVRLSLAESDNTAHFILLRNLEVEEVKEVYDHVGLEGFLKTEGKLSAKRYSALFRALYTASFLSQENSQKLLSFMTESPLDEFIQSGLPPDVIFAHKVGIEKEYAVFLDSGIVYGSRPYILTVMIQTEDKERAIAVIRDISSRVYDYVTKYAAGDATQSHD